MATLTRSQRRAAELNVLARRQRSLWVDAFDRLRRNKMAMVGLVVITFLVLLAILAEPLTKMGVLYDPVWNWYKEGRSCVPGEQGCSTGPVLKDPVWMANSDARFVFGTDQIGRDIFARLVWSARVSMVVGFAPVFLLFVIGTTVGMLAGYLGGRVDNLLMRIVDVLYAFPDLLLLIIIMATLRSTPLGQYAGGLPLIFFALAIVNWTGISRLVRGQVLSLKEKEFIEAARCIGVGTRRIMFRHLLPNTLAPVIVALSFAIPGAIFAEAGLSFLGIGIIPPTPSWGVMINEGFAVFYGTPWMTLLPAACIAMVMLSFTFLGDGLRDALDPRMKI